ncbi:hypothetical protein Fot_32070 [Forsythia ovata]|uniref:Uncharacterized protein n=1 Tax=Forsythia ovata TaxID=205694 RepID=A0ABD1T6R4_9LAMI
MAGFYFSYVHVFKIRGGRVVDERQTLSLRLLVPNEAPNSVSTIHPVVGAIGGVSSPPPLVVGGRDGSPSLLLEIFASPLVDAQHLVKEKGVTIGERENVASKRGLKGRDVVANSGRTKKSRTTLLQETSDSNLAYPIVA